MKILKSLLLSILFISSSLKTKGLENQKITILGLYEPTLDLKELQKMPKEQALEIIAKECSRQNYEHISRKDRERDRKRSLEIENQIRQIKIDSSIRKMQEKKREANLEYEKKRAEIKEAMIVVIPVFIFFCCYTIVPIIVNYVKWRLERSRERKDNKAVLKRLREKAYHEFF